MHEQTRSGGRADLRKLSVGIEPDKVEDMEVQGQGPSCAGPFRAPSCAQLSRLRVSLMGFTAFMVVQDSKAVHRDERTSIRIV
jgi:hypothetical protein